MTRFTQVDEGLRNASLYVIGMLGLEPGELAERYGLTFRPDDRGDTIAALIETRPGQQYMLLRHLDAPGPGTEVLASENSSQPRHDLQELLDAFALDPNVVTWAIDSNPRLAAGQSRR